MRIAGKSRPAPASTVFLILAVQLGSSGAIAQVPSRMAACATGTVMGGDYDAATGTYGWVCLNYDVSGEAEHLNCSCAGFDDCTATVEGGGSYDREEAGACLWDGDRVKVTAFQKDFMLMQDLCRDGGEAYLPGGLYLYEGCGDDSGRSPIDCPLVNQSNDSSDRWERLKNDSGALHMLSYTGRCTVYHEPTNADPFAEKRTGTWIVVDTGRKGLEVDRNGTGSTDVSLRAIGFGPGSRRTSGCSSGSWYPDGACAPDPTTDHLTSSANLWGVAGTVREDIVSHAPPRVCLGNDLPSTGTCRGNRWATCNTHADCDKGVLDLGPCEGFADAVEHEIGQATPVLLTFRMDDEPGNGEYSTCGYVDLVESGSCDGGNGRHVVFGTDPAPCGAMFEVDQDESAFPIREVFVTNPDTYFVGSRIVTVDGPAIMPNHWVGRDSSSACSNCPSGEHDCLSGGDGDAADDEANCDTSTLTSHHSGLGGIYRGIRLVGCSNAGFGCDDGTSQAIRPQLEDMEWSHVMRSGALADPSEWHYLRPRVVGPANLDFAGSFNQVWAQFSRGLRILDFDVSAVEGETLVTLDGHRDAIVTGTIRSSRFRSAAVKITRASGLSVDVTVESHDGPVVGFFNAPGQIVEHVDVRVQGDGGPHFSSSGGDYNVDANAAIYFGEHGNSDLSYEDISLELDYACATEDCAGVWFHTDGTGPNAADAMHEVHIHDSRLSGPAGTTGAALVAIGYAKFSGNVKTTTNADALLCTAEQCPRISDSSAGGVPVPDVPVAGPAAEWPDCDEAGYGALAYLLDDDASGGRCRHTDGLLDGGGSDASRCMCDGAGAWIDVATRVTGFQASVEVFQDGTPVGPPWVAVDDGPADHFPIPGILDFGPIELAGAAGVRCGVEETVGVDRIALAVGSCRMEHVGGDPAPLEVRIEASSSGYPPIPGPVSGSLDLTGQFVDVGASGNVSVLATGQTNGGPLAPVGAASPPASFHVTGDPAPLEAPIAFVQATVAVGLGDPGDEVFLPASLDVVVAPTTSVPTLPLCALGLLVPLLLLGARWSTMVRGSWYFPRKPAASRKGQ